MLGDISNHGYFRMSDQEIIQDNKYVYDKLKQYFPDTLILPSLGNHETSPIEQFDFSIENFTTINIIPLYE